MFGIYKYWDLFRRLQSGVVLHQNFPLAKWQYRAQLKQGPAQTSSHFFILTLNSNNSIFVFWKVFIFSRNGIIFELYLEYRTVLASLTGLDKTSFWWVQTSSKWVSMYLINNTLFLIFVISSIVWKWIMDMKIFSVAGIWELDENMIGIFHSGRDTTYTQWPSTVISDGQLFFFCLIRRKI